MQPLGRRLRKDVALQFGATIALPVSVYTAVADDRDSKLHNACKDGHELTRSKQRTYCPVCDADSKLGDDPTPRTFVKAKQEGETLVEIDAQVQEAILAADAEFEKEMLITAHPVEEVTSQLQPSGKSYYLDVDKDAGKTAYALIAATITERSDLAFMCRFTIKTAASVFRLVVGGDGTLILQMMADPRLMREMPVVEPARPLKAAELNLGSTLADLLTEPFVAERFTRSKAEILARYTAGKVPVEFDDDQEPQAGDGNIDDLTALLQASIDAADTKRSAA